MFKRDGSKRKADTDCANLEFSKSLAQRAREPVDNFKNRNIDLVHSMNSGKPPREHYKIPDGVEVYGYGGQKLNIWEIQKE
jgi:hypothetical protein